MVAQAGSADDVGVEGSKERRVVDGGIYQSLTGRTRQAGNVWLQELEGRRKRLGKYRQHGGENGVCVVWEEGEDEGLGVVLVHAAGRLALWLEACRVRRV